MKKLKFISFPKISVGKTYIVSITPYMGNTGPILYASKGGELIKKIIEIFYIEEDEYNNVKEMLRAAESLNGDGWDLVDVYEG